MYRIRAFRGASRLGSNRPQHGFSRQDADGEAVGAVAAARSHTAYSLINVARMVGATTGLAILGALFAGAHDGSNRDCGPSRR